MDLSCKSHDDNSNHLVHQNCTYTLYVFRLENRSMFFTCVVGVDRQLSVSATCVRYVCLALFKSVLHFRASHLKLEDLRTTNLSQECQVNCNNYCLPACENQLPSC